MMPEIYSPFICSQSCIPGLIQRIGKPSEVCVVKLHYTKPSFSMDKHTGKVALPRAWGKTLQSAFYLAHHTALHSRRCGGSTRGS